MPAVIVCINFLCLINSNINNIMHIIIANVIICKYNAKIMINNPIILNILLILLDEISMSGNIE